MVINKGEILVLDNNKEYIVVDVINRDVANYLYLTTTITPPEIILGKQVNGEDGSYYVDTVTDIREIEYILLAVANGKDVPA